MLTVEVKYNTRITKTIGRHDMYNISEPEYATKRKEKKTAVEESIDHSER